MLKNESIESIILTIVNETNCGLNPLSLRLSNMLMGEILENKRMESYKKSELMEEIIKVTQFYNKTKITRDMSEFMMNVIKCLALSPFSDLNFKLIIDNWNPYRFLPKAQIFMKDEKLILIRKINNILLNDFYEMKLKMPLSDTDRIEIYKAFAESNRYLMEKLVFNKLLDKCLIYSAIDIFSQSSKYSNEFVYTEHNFGILKQFYSNIYNNYIDTKKLLEENIYVGKRN